jgi:hypothetical protein
LLYLWTTLLCVNMSMDINVWNEEQSPWYAQYEHEVVCFYVNW